MKSKEEVIKENSATSLVRGLAVLECFGKRQRHRYTLAELSRELNVPKSSMHRVLKTLSDMDYVRYEEHSKHYYLGVRVLSLGFTLLNSMEFREIARPYMEKISHECNKTINLAVLDRDEMVYVERVSVRSIRQYNISTGTRITPWKSAIGRSVLAYLEPDKVAEMIRSAKKKGTFTFDDAAFAKILAETRKKGFAVDNQETRKGIVAIAVPIFSAKGVFGAINLIAEPEEISFAMLKKNYAPALIEVGNQLSKALGYQEQKFPEELL